MNPNRTAMRIPNLAAREAARAEVERFANALPNALAGVGRALALLRRDGAQGLVSNGSFNRIFFEARGVPWGLLRMVEASAEAIAAERPEGFGLPPEPEEKWEASPTADALEQAAANILALSDGVQDMRRRALALADAPAGLAPPGRKTRERLGKMYESSISPVMEMLEFGRLLAIRRGKDSGASN